MSELNEKDLAQVSGGAGQLDGQEDEWVKRNCKICPEQPKGCTRRREMIIWARSQRAKGRDDECIQLRNIRRSGGL